MSNGTTDQIREDKEAFQKDLISKFNKNPKRFYGYVRTLQKVRQEIVNIRRSDGSLTETDQQAAEELCMNFEKVFVNEPSLLLSHGQRSDMVIHFEERDIEGRLKRLVTNKSPEPDGIHPLLLQRCAEQLSKPIKILFEKSMGEGKLPDDW